MEPFFVVEFTSPRSGATAGLEKTRKVPVNSSSSFIVEMIR
ncbi:MULTISPECIES: hypothetical protein [Actinoalloteichus]|nr:MULTISPECIES: hypothetical protein [Actinoalloteichus]